MKIIAFLRRVSRAWSRFVNSFAATAVASNAEQSDHHMNPADVVGVLGELDGSREQRRD